LLDEARSAFVAPGICIVEPALHAARLGAVAMHDPTEGGLSSGLYELAEASGTGLFIDSDAVLWIEAGLAICARLDANPWGMLASGTLLAGFAPARAAGAVATLRELGYPVAVIGHATADAKICFVDGSALPRFERDELSRLLEAG
jgi:hydrogenase maturation factor